MDLKILIIALLICDVLFVIAGWLRKYLGHSVLLFAAAAVLSVAVMAVTCMAVNQAGGAREVPEQTEESAVWPNEAAPADTPKGTKIQ